MKYFLLAVLAAFTYVAPAQSIRDTNPFTLRWQQINTSNFRVLFPVGFETQAQRMANTLELIHEPESRTLGARPRRIPIILQNQSAISNGFVSLAPRRSEFFGMPTQDNNFVGTNDWLTLLAVHEYRHIVQFQKSITGFNKLIYYALGQQALAAMSFVAAPQWFWEGDAVAIETAFTPSGRGRIPHFDAQFRANLLQGRSFNYHKQYLRSYKHNIPNHYVLGYHLVSYLRKKTDNPMIWGNIAENAWRTPFRPFTFSYAVKKETGLTLPKLYREMAKELTAGWEREQRAIVPTTGQRLNPRRGKTYTDYLYPQPLSDGSVAVVRSGIGDIAEVVALTDSTQRKIFTMGPVNASGMLSAAGHRVVWNELRFDPRWRARSYSTVTGVDMKTGKKLQWAKQSRWAAAALSPDGKYIATVETTTDYRTQLVIIDVQSGQVVTQLPNPGNVFISQPRWMTTNRLLAIETTTAGRKMVAYSMTGSRNELFDFGQENIGVPVPYKNFVFYNSPLTGIDNVFALDTVTRRRYQVTEARYGMYNAAPSADGRFLYINSQEPDGMDVLKIELNPKAWTLVEGAPTMPARAFGHLVQQEGFTNLLASVPQSVYAIKPYSRTRGLINPHSWGPYFENTVTQAEIGISSRDLLSTTTMSAGYTIDAVERTGLASATVSYQGFYPALSASVLRGSRTTETSVLGRDVEFDWKETGVSAGASIPLLLTRSKYNAEAQFGTSVGWTQVSGFESTISRNNVLVGKGTDRIVPANDSLDFVFIDRVGNGQLLTNRTYFSYARSFKTSRRDFNPRWAQLADIEYYSTPFGGDYNGSLFAARTALYFPGLFRHHSIVLRAGYQESPDVAELNNYAFRNRIVRPRGYSFPRDKSFVSLSANYALPLWYPDLALGPYLNIQRVRLNAFADYGEGAGRSYFYHRSKPLLFFSDGQATYLSLGGELTFDINVFRFLPQFEVGVRASYLTANDFNQAGLNFELLLGSFPF
jgi:hypothetical protein